MICVILVAALRSRLQRELEEEAELEIQKDPTSTGTAQSVLPRSLLPVDADGQVRWLDQLAQLFH